MHKYQDCGKPFFTWINVGNLVKIILFLPFIVGILYLHSLLEQDFFLQEPIAFFQFVFLILQVFEILPVLGSIFSKE